MADIQIPGPGSAAFIAAAVAAWAASQVNMSDGGGFVVRVVLLVGVFVLGAFGYYVEKLHVDAGLRKHRLDKDLDESGHPRRP